jgi:hypothetical protein
LRAGPGWLDEFPPVLARRLGWVAAAGLAALVALMVSLVLARGADQAVVEGANLSTMAFATHYLDCVLPGQRWRRMRDSNSRGVAPNTLSNNADQRSPAVATVRGVLIGVPADCAGRP